MKYLALHEDNSLSLYLSVIIGRLVDVYKEYNIMKTSVLKRPILNARVPRINPVIKAFILVACILIQFKLDTFHPLIHFIGFPTF